jgi:hypothetical protein
MSTMLPVRAYNRSQSSRVQGKRLSPTQTALVNLDNPRTQRDLGRHSAIGAIRTVGSPIEQNDDGVVVSGGLASITAGDNTVSVTAVSVTDGSGNRGANAADTVDLAVGDNTNPRIDTIALDVSSVTSTVTTTDVVKIDGTATAGANAFNLTGRGTVPADRIVLAYVLVPKNLGSATTDTTADTFTLTNHGLVAGQALWLTSLTTSTGLTAGNTYYVIASGLTANVFKVSATRGGAAVDIGGANGSALWNTGPTAVVDARP